MQKQGMKEKSLSVPLPISPAVSQNSYPEIMAIGDLSSYLQLHAISLYRLLGKGKIPGAKKIGGQWRVKKSMVDKWFEGRVK